VNPSARATYGPDIVPERAFQAHVEQMCRMLGLRFYHTHDSRRSQRGFLDLVIVGRKVLFRELKTTRGRVTPEQQEWLDALTAAGQDAAVWRPDQWDQIQTELEDIAR
jgi:hypothetical protein